MTVHHPMQSWKYDMVQRTDHRPQHSSEPTILEFRTIESIRSIHPFFRMSITCALKIGTGQPVLSFFFSFFFMSCQYGTFLHVVLYDVNSLAVDSFWNSFEVLIISIQCNLETVFNIIQNIEHKQVSSIYYTIYSIQSVLLYTNQSINQSQHNITRRYQLR